MADVDSRTVFGLFAFVGSLILGSYGWLIKHISNSRKHTSADRVIYKDVCEERGKANIQAHEHLQRGIKDAMARSDEQHIELKADMKSGFSEIKEILRRGSND